MAGLCQFWRTCFFFFLFLFGQRFLDNPSADSRQILHVGVLWFRMSSPLLGVSGSREAEKGGNEIFVTVGVNQKFLDFGGFWAISQQRVDNVCWRAPPPLESIGPWDAGVGGVKNWKMGDGLIRAVNSYHFYFSQRFQM